MGPSKKIKVYIVDDQINVITTFIEAMGFEVVGKDIYPESDLDKKIRDNEVDVLVMDLHFGCKSKGAPKREAYGIPAIRTVRRSVGTGVGIIAYTGYEDWDEVGLCAGGADAIVIKNKAPAQEMAEKIRTCRNHEAIGSLELDIERRSVAIIISCPGSHARKIPLVGIRANEFALLCYLALERKSAGSQWLSRSRSNQAAPPYVFSQKQLWATICKQVGARTQETWENEIVRTCANTINSSVPGSTHDGHLKLICGPPLGRPSEGEIIAPMYCLNEFIEPMRTTIQGLDPNQKTA
jgi:CheY-like chemotaxis protein